MKKENKIMETSLIEEQTYFERAGMRKVSALSVDYRRFEDEGCLRLFVLLGEALEECEAFSERHLNLVSIFFHQLYYISAATFLKWSEVKVLGFDPESLYPVAPQLMFPYIGYQELTTRRIGVSARQFPSARRAVSPNREVLNAFARISSRSARVAFAGGAGSLMGEVSRAFLFSKIRPVFPESAKVFIPRVREQLAVFEQFARKVVREFDLPFHSDEYFLLLKHYIKPFLAEEERSVSWKVLVTGTLLDIENRILAARTRAARLPVVTLSHGEGDQFIVDEPRVGYGEMTYSSVLIGYGSAGNPHGHSSQFKKGIYGLPEFVGSNSDVCRRIFRPDAKIKRVSDFTNPRFMYVPTAFMGMLRCGPYLSLPDATYLDWQKTIQTIFPRIAYKEHPKTAFLCPLPFERVIRGNLQDCLSFGDVFVFDYLSTAFLIAAATDKPIIYFDLGLRQIDPRAKALIKQRCLWIDATHNKDLDYLRSELGRLRDCEMHHGLTEAYTLGGGKEARWQTIAQKIKELL